MHTFALLDLTSYSLELHEDLHCPSVGSLYCPCSQGSKGLQLRSVLSGVSPF